MGEPDNLVDIDRTLTRQGFTKAAFLTDDQIETVLTELAGGASPGKACRAAGTSFTQFLRRVKRDEALYKRYREAEDEGRRRADLSS